MVDPISGGVGAVIGSALVVGARAISDWANNNKYVRKDLCELHVKMLSDLLKRVEQAVEKTDERVQQLQRSAMPLAPTRQIGE